MPDSDIVKLGFFVVYLVLGIIINFDKDGLKILACAFFLVAVFIGINLISAKYGSTVSFLFLSSIVLVPLVTLWIKGKTVKTIKTEMKGEGR